MIQSFIIPVFGAEPLAGVDMESSLVSNYSNQVLSISTQHHSCPTWSLKLRRFSFIACLLEPLRQIDITFFITLFYLRKTRLDHRTRSILA